MHLCEQGLVFVRQTENDILLRTELEDLQQQEQNMKWAAAQLTQQNATEQ